MAPSWRLIVRPRLFTWNLPDRQNIAGMRWWIRVLCYVGKCMPVVRKATPEETRRTLDKVAFLLSRGQTVLVFPEGGRSRVGRVDTENFSYGVGRMLQETPAARVLCVYLARPGPDGASATIPRPARRCSCASARCTGDLVPGHARRARPGHADRPAAERNGERGA